MVVLGMFLAKEIPKRGHSLTIDKVWREVAQAALDGLKATGQ